MKKHALIIGAGFAGSSASLFLAQKGWRVTVVEKETFIGGGCKTQYYGGHPYMFGPRHFLSSDETMYEFLNGYTPMRRIPDHEFLTYVERDPGFYHFPIHRDDVDLMPDKDNILQELNDRGDVTGSNNLEEYWLNSVGPTLYDKLVNHYTKKMWQIESNRQFDKGEWSAKAVALKTGPKAAWTEAISAHPTKMNGYDDYFEATVSAARVLLDTEVEKFDLDNKRVRIKGEWVQYDILISTISPEIILDYAFGELRWMGRELWKIVFPVPEVFPKNVYFLYYANAEPFTRLVEFKKFFQYESPTTLVTMEIPSLKNKLYPYPMKDQQALARKYLDALPENVYSIGRAGCYDYTIGIAGAILQARDLVSNL